MTTERNKSAIAEVRDQLSLDYADGKYLSVATANLGLTRPPFGFSDDSWRAITKVLALQYKQIRSKFEDVLTIMFGPRITVGATLLQDAPVGSRTLQVNDASALPQVGTVRLDEGLAADESVEYSFVDYKTNTVYLSTETINAHLSYGTSDADEPLILNATAGDTTLHLPNTRDYPTTGFPVTLVVGKGTASEEVVTISANDTDASTLTISALANNHSGATPSALQDQLLVAYAPTSEFLVLTDTSTFPDTGYVLLGPSSTTVTATGGTGTTVTVTSGDLTEDRQVGSLFVFDGNITPALAGVEAEVVSNTFAGAVFRTALPASPVAGDTFTIRPFVRYTRNVYSDNALQIYRDLVDAEYISGTEVELLDSNATALLAPVKVAGTDWEVIQSYPRNIEIYLPEDLQDLRTIRSASYLHPEEVAPTPTTTSAGASIGDTTLAVTDSSGFPSAGQIVIDELGLNEEHVAYRKARLVGVYDSALSTSTTLNFTGVTFAGNLVGQRVFISDTRTSLSTSRVITSFTGTSVTFADPLNSLELAGLVTGQTKIGTFSTTTLEIPSPEGLVVVHIGAESVAYHEVIYAGTNLQSGDIWNDLYVWPGPYVYDPTFQAPSGAIASTTLSDSVAGPTGLACGQIVTNTALEVADATLFPLGAASPFTAVIGRGTGNREFITIDDVNLRDRAATTVSVASIVGATSVEVTALSGGGTADAFPDAKGYRVMLSRGTVREEIVWVIGTAAAPNRLLIEAATQAHNIGDSVELLADVLSVDPLDDNHVGYVSYGARKSAETPINISTTLADPGEIGDNFIIVSSTGSFPSVGKLRLDGHDYTYAVGVASTLSILDTTGLRTAPLVSSPVYLLVKQNTPENVEVRYSSIPATTTAGFSSAGGSIMLNYGKGFPTAKTTLDTLAAPGATSLSVVSSDEMPVVYSYEVVINEGGYTEERHLVTLNNTTTDTLSLNGGAHGLVNSHPVGTTVTFYSGDPGELLEYDSLTASTFVFDTPIILSSNHSAGESVVISSQRSIADRDGFDFPLRIPTDIKFRLLYLIDLIRAAGIQVTFIEQR